MLKIKKYQEIIPLARNVLTMSAIITIVYGIIMIYKTLIPYFNENSKIQYTENYIDRTEIFDDVYIVETAILDTLNTYTKQYELYVARNTYSPKQAIFGAKFNLSKESDKKQILLSFAAFYLLLSTAWILLFYNLRKILNSHKKKSYFDEQNIQRLFNSSQIILGIAVIKFFGPIIISIWVNMWCKVYLQLQNYNYELITTYFLLILLAHLFKVIAMAYSKGYFIEKEQSLTI